MDDGSLNERDALRSYINATETTFIVRGLNNRSILLPISGSEPARIAAMSEFFEFLRSQLYRESQSFRLLNNTLAQLHSLLFIFSSVDSLVIRYTKMCNQEADAQRRGVYNIPIASSSPETPASLYTRYDINRLQIAKDETIAVFVKRIADMRMGRIVIAFDKRVLSDASFIATLYEEFDEAMLRVYAVFDRVDQEYENPRDGR